MKKFNILLAAILFVSMLFGTFGAYAKNGEKKKTRIDYVIKLVNGRFYQGWTYHFWFRKRFPLPNGSNRYESFCRKFHGMDIKEERFYGYAEEVPYNIMAQIDSWAIDYGSGEKVRGKFKLISEQFKNNTYTATVKWIR